MALRILGIAASPRGDGNTDLLLREVLRGAADAGAQTEFLALRSVQMRPCIECNACQKTGRCAVQDGMTPIFDKLVTADGLVFASPVFFTAVSAYAKIMIDRCQCFWSLKYVLRRPLFDPPRPERRGLFVGCCGWRKRSMFDGARRTVKALFDVLEADYAGELLYPEVDAKGDILAHPTALADARRAGAALARAEPIPTARSGNE